ncbi:MAG: TetR/AcrR family transcriptional regulator [Proteobacteria bacterium]|nr:TetR/AcrR family transcriptional regulator [Pseudomonadota bacterium]
MLIMFTTEKNNPRSRILEVADQLFYSEGIRATGTEKIMAAADVAKATFYRHFESKDALVLAYLDNRDKAFWEYLGGPDAPSDVHSALSMIDRYVNRTGVIGCPFLRVAAEYPDPDHPLHRRVVAHKDRLLRYLAKLMPTNSPDPEEFARMLVAIIDGALSMRLVFGPAQEVPLLATAERIFQSRRA